MIVTINFIDGEIILECIISCKEKTCLKLRVYLYAPIKTIIYTEIYDLQRLAIFVEL